MTTQVIAELDEIIQLLESQRLGGVNSPAAKVLQRKFTRALSLYFRRLAREFPYDALSGYVSKYAPVKEAAEDKAALLIIAKAVDGASPEVEFIVKDYLEQAYLLGATEAHLVAKIKPTMTLIDEGAVKWMKKHAAELVTNLDDVTKQKMANILVQGTHKGESAQKIARTLRDEFTDMSKGRAEMIAQNELNEAMSEASLNTYKRLGIEGKSWSVALEPCEICLGNEAEGIIPIGRLFSSGNEHPPGHPRCLCTLTPERLS